MKQIIRIFFLYLTIVFSFGFTVSTNACQQQSTEIHSCCQKEKKEEGPKHCTGECCVQTTTVSLFKESEVISITKTVSLFSLKSLTTTKHNNSVVDCDKLLGYSVYKTPVFKKHRSLLSQYQVWLI